MAGWSQLSWQKKTESTEVPWHVLSIFWTYSKPLGVWTPYSVGTWRVGISAWISFAWVLESFVSSLDFGFKPSEPWLQHALVGQVLQPGPCLEQVFFLCWSCLYLWFCPTEICPIAWSKGAIKPQTLKRLLQTPHCLGYVLFWKEERAF